MKLHLSLATVLAAVALIWIATCDIADVCDSPDEKPPESRLSLFEPGAQGSLQEVVPAG